MVVYLYLCICIISTFLGVFIYHFIMIVFYLIASFKILHWMSSLLPHTILVRLVFFLVFI